MHLGLKEDIRNDEEWRFLWTVGSLITVLSGASVRYNVSQIPPEFLKI